MRGGLGARVRKPGAVITVDLPGHGLTGAWPRREYTIETYADFIEMLVDALKLDRFALIGHSLAVWPGRRGNAAGSREPAHPGRLRGLSTRRWLVAMAGAAGTSAAGRRYRHPFHSPVVGAPVTELSHFYADPAMVTAESVQRTAELQRFPGNHEATLQRARTQPRLHLAPPKRLDVPTLILWGGTDRWLPVADAFHLQNDIKGAGLEIFEKRGHDLMEEDAEATAASIPRRDRNRRTPIRRCILLFCRRAPAAELKPSDAAFPTLARVGRPIGNRTRTSNYIVGNAGPVGAAPCTTGKPRSIPSAASTAERTTGGR